MPPGKDSKSDFLEMVTSERRADAEAEVGRKVVAALKGGERSLIRRLREGGVSIVAELKKASPSAGLLRSDYRPAETASAYERAGAAGISVLTEPRHFLGSVDDLVAVRNAVDVPVLRKDFTCHARHVEEAAQLGADVVLLIVAALDESLLVELYRLAESLGLETLVETHSIEELPAALSLDNAIIGVNSRNLKTLKTDLSVARSMAVEIPKDRVSIAESGIKSRDEVRELMELGYDGFLIGETLMRAENPAGKLAQFL